MCLTQPAFLALTIRMITGAANKRKLEGEKKNNADNNSNRNIGAASNRKNNSVRTLTEENNSVARCRMNSDTAKPRNATCGNGGNGKTGVIAKSRRDDMRNNASKKLSAAVNRKKNGNNVCALDQPISLGKQPNGQQPGQNPRQSAKLLAEEAFLYLSKMALADSQSFVWRFEPCLLISE